MAEATTLPVLLIFFNRADCVERTLAAIRAVRPPRLYLATDAPRPAVPEDAARCAAVRALVDRMIDWPCEVHRLVHHTNQGSGCAASLAASWIFTHEERAVIFEDDCVPDPAFFPFCEELLERYANEPRVAMISGNQFVPGGWKCRHDASYALVQLPQIWGWATWRRAWANFDATMAQWPAARDARLLERIFNNRHDRRYWRKRFDACHRNEIDVWDYRWAFARWYHDQLSIMPARNLVTYIGFRPDAEHTVGEHPAANLSTAPLPRPLRHPVDLSPDRALDRKTVRILFYEGNWFTYQRDKLWRWLRALFRS